MLLSLQCWIHYFQARLLLSKYIFQSLRDKIPKYLKQRNQSHKKFSIGFQREVVCRCGTILLLRKNQGMAQFCIPCERFGPQLGMFCLEVGQRTLVHLILLEAPEVHEVSMTLYARVKHPHHIFRPPSHREGRGPAETCPQ